MHPTISGGSVVYNITSLSVHAQLIAQNKFLCFMNFIICSAQKMDYKSLVSS